MKSKNLNLNRARKARNDEFYTQYEDIEKELVNYDDKLKDKWVYCPCDDWKASNFTKYFIDNFKKTGLRHLTCTAFNRDGKSVRFDYDGTTQKISDLEGNGDFISEECTKIMESCDIVATNPPFSLFRDHVKLLMDNNKKFLIIGNSNAITYKEIFPLIKDNKIWLGNNWVKSFRQPDDSIKKFGNICWFTNLEFNKRHEELTLVDRYDPDEHPKYDNYDAVEVSNVVHIPKDYDGVMGVPITFLDKFNPDQFEIVGLTSSSSENSSEYHINGGTRAFINGKPTYARILIKNKHPENNISKDDDEMVQVGCRWVRKDCAEYLRRCLESENENKMTDE